MDAPRNVPRPEIEGLVGTPETVLTRALVESLPPNESPAPWSVRCSGLVWIGRGGAAASRALPPALQSSQALMTIGGFIRYNDTPVGPYDEAFGLVAARSGATSWGTVAFMAVDSPASLVGGRTNWAMPKTLSTFTGEPTNGTTMTAQSADGIEWSVSATARAVGPAIPNRSRSKARQQFADGRVGTAMLSFRGRMRPALVTVDVRSEGTLGSWMRSGRHVGAIIESATFTLGEPRLSGVGASRAQQS